MTFTDPNNQANPTDTPVDAVANESTVENKGQPELDAASATSTAEQSAEAAAQAKRILIGSQRDPAAYRARQRRDWKPLDEEEKQKKKKKDDRHQDRGEKPAGSQQSAVSGQPPAASRQPAVVSRQPSAIRVEASVGNGEEKEIDKSPILNQQISSPQPLAARPSAPVSLSEDDSPMDIEAELDRAMGNASMDDLLGGGEANSDEQIFEPNSQQVGRIAAVRRDDVFVEFPGRQQGIISLRQFNVPPRPGTEIQVVVQRLDPEDGIYELSLPNKAVQVDDWSDLVEGSLVEVHITGHNTGGLECEVNHIRGFIPVSQISLYRVEDLAPYVDQRMTCIITEADPERRNLVVSRRAVLEREKEQAREQMLHSLTPGQVFDGVVRKLMDFGAFVDIGNGVDGLLHISQLAWGRVKHPSDVLQEGQTIKVRIEKVNPETGRISLTYRDLLENPWTEAARNYPPRSIAKGTVTKLMDFGAFVEIAPGIEGLVHISELSPKRVWRASDVVKEGQEVEVMVLSVDTAAQRMSLSMKELIAPPETTKKEDELAEAATSKKSSKPTGPLLGGLGRRSGERFGLKW